MKSGRSDLERVRDMRQAIANISLYRDAVQRNPVPLPEGLLEQATVDNLMIIGEAANRLSPAVRQLERAIPWTQIVGLRNAVVHQYHGRIPAIIQKTVKEDLPVLDAALARIEQQLTKEEGTADT